MFGFPSCPVSSRASRLKTVWKSWPFWLQGVAQSRLHGQIYSLLSGWQQDVFPEFPKLQREDEPHMFTSSRLLSTKWIETRGRVSCRVTGTEQFNNDWTPQGCHVGNMNSENLSWIPVCIPQSSLKSSHFNFTNVFTGSVILEKITINVISAINQLQYTII